MGESGSLNDLRKWLGYDRPSQFASDWKLLSPEEKQEFRDAYAYASVTPVPA